MKKAFLINLFFCFLAISLFAQDDEDEKGFKKQNLFTKLLRLIFRNSVEDVCDFFSHDFR